MAAQELAEIISAAPACPRACSQKRLALGQLDRTQVAREITKSPGQLIEARQRAPSNKEVRGWANWQPDARRQKSPSGTRAR